MAERTKATDLKSVVGSRPPGVRIPLTPPWGGARVVDWGRLLSGCRGIKPRPQVRILSSPLSFVIKIIIGSSIVIGVLIPHFIV